MHSQTATKQSQKLIGKPYEANSRFPPHHLVDDAYIALDNLNYLSAYILVHIVGHGDAVVAVAAEADGGVDRL